MVHPSGTLAHRPAGVHHHRTALMIIGIAIVMIGGLAIIGLVRSTAVPTVRPDVQQAQIARSAESMQLTRAAIKADHLFVVTRAGRGTVEAPAVLLRDRSDYGDLLERAVSGPWNNPLRVALLQDRLAYGYAREAAVTGRR